ncbi:MAG: hypothetical protein ROW39_12500, partial [Anaerolineaceae bacterium]
MTGNMTDQALVIVADMQTGPVFEHVFSALDVQGVFCPDRDSAREFLKAHSPALIICSDTIPGESSANLSSELLQDLPAIPHILLADEPSFEVYKSAIRSGYSDCITWPLHAEDVQRAIQAALERSRHRSAQILAGEQVNTTGLLRRVEALETLQQLGNSITSSLDLDNVLADIV